MNSTSVIVGLSISLSVIVVMGLELYAVSKSSPETKSTISLVVGNIGLLAAIIFGALYLSGYKAPLSGGSSSPQFTIVRDYQNTTFTPLGGEFVIVITGVTGNAMQILTSPQVTGNTSYVGKSFYIHNGNSSTLTITPSTGMTIIGPSNPVTIAQNKTAQFVWERVIDNDVTIRCISSV